jgi:hypothetical protein
MKMETKLILGKGDIDELIMICRLINQDDLVYNCDTDNHNFRKRIIDFADRVLESIQ